MDDNVTDRCRIPGAEPGSEVYSPPHREDRPNAITGGHGGSRLRHHWKQWYPPTIPTLIMLPGIPTLGPCLHIYGILFEFEPTLSQGQREEEAPVTCGLERPEKKYQKLDYSKQSGPNTGLSGSSLL